MKNTCEGCTERVPGCHAKCEKYNKALYEYHLLKNQASPNIDAIGYTADRTLKIRKAQRRINRK